MSLSFAQLWQQEAASDLDVIILAPATASESGQQRKQHACAGRPAMLELAKFPAHSAMLCNSAVLWCRVGDMSQAMAATPATADVPMHP